MTTAVEDAGETSRSSNQSIARASRLLRCFVDSPGGLTLTELSRRTGLHPSTAHRMMNALVDGGLVAKGDRDRYRPGIALLALGASASVAMGIDAALPFLETLTERTGESASLAVKDTDCAVVMLETQSSQRLIARHGTGARLSLQDSAHGQILLAYADDPAAEIRTLPRPIVRGREYTDADALLEEILGVRQRGYSLISDGDQAGTVGTDPSDERRPCGTGTRDNRNQPSAHGPVDRPRDRGRHRRRGPVARCAPLTLRDFVRDPPTRRRRDPRALSRARWRHRVLRRTRRLADAHRRGGRHPRRDGPPVVEPRETTPQRNAMPKRSWCSAVSPSAICSTPTPTR